MNETQREIFIECLRGCGLEATCAREAQTSLVNLRNEYDSDPAFYEEALEAQALITDRIEAEAFRRAVDGVVKPVYYKGQRVDEIVEYSDTLLARMLAGRRPELYGDKKQISGEDGGPVKIVIQEFDFL